MEKLVNFETNYNLLQKRIEECLTNEQKIILNICSNDGGLRCCFNPEELHFTYEELIIEDKNDDLMIEFQNCQSIEYDEYEESFCLKYPSLEVYIEFLEFLE